MSWSIYRNNGGDGKSDLVSPESLVAAQEHKITIDIMPPFAIDGEPITSITGFMKEAFSYSVNATYDSVLPFNEPDNKLIDVMKDVTQKNAAFFSGYGSKRMFQPGKNYVKLNLKFRAYDEPDVISTCDLLTKCCLPIMDSGNIMLGTNGVDVLNNVQNAILDNSADKAAKDANSDKKIEAFASIPTDFYKAAIQQLSTSMPPHLRVNIGSYFQKSEMVLTQCQFTFSKEFTRNNDGAVYPTYVDFDLEVESLFSSLALSNTKDNGTQNQIFGPGFVSTLNEQRVKVITNYANTNPIQEISKVFDPTMTRASDLWDIVSKSGSGQ